MLRASYYLHPKFLIPERILFGSDATNSNTNMQYQNNTSLPLQLTFYLSKSNHYERLLLQGMVNIIGKMLQTNKIKGHTMPLN